MYCLTCGQGAYIQLPAQWFVDQHSKDHGVTETERARSFVVMERPVDDDSIELPETLGILLQRDWLKIKGLPKMASKFR